MHSQTGQSGRKKQSVSPRRCFKDLSGVVFDHAERKYFHDAGNPKDNYCDRWVILGSNVV